MEIIKKLINWRRGTYLILSCFRKNPNGGEGGGGGEGVEVGDIAFPGVLKKEHVEMSWVS